jgi:hypothetical protein
MDRPQITNFIQSDINKYPLSFRLLQQEGFLSRSCLLAGFHYLLLGNFEDQEKGNYYAAFFQLTVGIERILKLVPVSDYMLKNNFQKIPEKELRNIGHNLLSLFDISINRPVTDEVINFPGKESLEYRILSFLNDFADSRGRYYNISNQNGKEDPLVAWNEILREIARSDFGEAGHREVENTTFANVIIPLQIEDIAFNTGYVDNLHKYYQTRKANSFAVWHIINILKPVSKLLYEISSECHKQYEDLISSGKTFKDHPNSDYPPIPYYDEFFPFVEMSKAAIIRRKNWIAY